jgi:CubicO group peptidase (beta-lactamase class C family)/D-alanyl-D-alanine dipeptidase
MDLFEFRRISCLIVVLIVCQTLRAEAAPGVGALPGYEALAGQLERLIRHEMEDKGLPAVSIALVDGQQIVWAAGFGWADRERRVRANADTVYRVGSVSKLFTDVALMQLVERGLVDLDRPVTDYLADFRPENRFPNGPITVRQLTGHRAGLVREPPLGNYFDAGEPTLAATVESLNRTALVYAPGTRTKYSNAGVAVVGYLLERRLGKPFSDCVREAVLAPVGTERTDFEPTPAIRDHLAEGQMWTYDGRIFAAPRFGLGTAPAGNLYSTVLDLSRFLVALFNDGQAPGGRLLKPETLRQMWTVQPGTAADQRKFGIGFAIGELDGNLLVGHGGAIYGFATELAALPDQKLGAVVIATKDLANAVVKRVADEALRRLLARRAGKNKILPDVAWPEGLPAERARSLAGRYVGETGTAELFAHGGRLVMRQGEFRLALKSRGDELVADDLLASKPTVTRHGPGGLTIDGKPYRRLPDDRPAAAPSGWQGLIGEYGSDHNTLYVLEEYGRLTALIEWCFYYPLKELGPDEFGFPDYGLYQDEKVVFHRDERGRATRVEAAGVRFERRPVGLSERFRIAPVKSIADLRRESLAADAPADEGEFRQPDLVEISSLDPTIRLDIRYASDDNFLGTAVYTQPRAFLQRPAAEALLRVHRQLKGHGYGLLIHDAYRPWHVTRTFWEATPRAQRMFVADPSKGSRHNRGCAVDLTLYSLADGRPAALPSAYDEFSPRAFPDYPGGTSEERWHRELLREAMESEGFSVNEFEWWHFDYRDWRHYPIMNRSFEEIAP